MKTHILLTLSLLCIFNNAYTSDEQRTAGSKTRTFAEEIKAQAQRYLELIGIVDVENQLKKKLVKFLQERYENACMCLATDKNINAYQCETTYNNRYIFMDESVIETDFNDRILYFYEKIVHESLDGALQQKFNTCKTWKEQDTLRLTVKHDFARATLDLLSQKTEDSK